MSIVKKIQYNVCFAVIASVVLFSSFLAVADEPQKTPTAQQKPLIITTIKPLAIIAKSAVADNARVEYLQSAVQSAHEVSLPVSALKKIERAELIIWIGDGFEARIGKPMALLSFDIQLQMFYVNNWSDRYFRCLKLSDAHEIFVEFFEWHSLT